MGRVGDLIFLEVKHRVGKRHPSVLVPWGVTDKLLCLCIIEGVPPSVPDH